MELRRDSNLVSVSSASKLKSRLYDQRRSIGVALSTTQNLDLVFCICQFTYANYQIPIKAVVFSTDLNLEAQPNFFVRFIFVLYALDWQSHSETPRPHQKYSNFSNVGLANVSLLSLRDPSIFPFRRILTPVWWKFSNGSLNTLGDNFKQCIKSIRHQNSCHASKLNHHHRKMPTPCSVLDLDVFELWSPIWFQTMAFASQSFRDWLRNGIKATYFMILPTVLWHLRKSITIMSTACYFLALTFPKLHHVSTVALSITNLIHILALPNLQPKYSFCKVERRLFSTG